MDHAHFQHVRFYEDAATYEAARLRLVTIDEEPEQRLRYEAAIAAKLAVKAYASLFGRTKG